MIAKQLETLLSSEAAHTDFSQRAPADLVQRFQALRGFGLLPRGRGKNAQHLTHREAVAGILSIVADKPGYAGTASKMLMGLKPIGGVSASFRESKTFGAALVQLLEAPDALESLIEVRASGSEIYTNGYGRGAVIYSVDGNVRTAYYISELATSLMGQGSEKAHDPRELISTTINETIYFPRFFERIVREMRIDYPPHAFDHLIDPDDEEIERQKEERIKRLGISGSSNFLNIPVDTQVTWPREETVVEFGGKKLVMMPKTKDSDTSIHVDLHGQRINSAEAHTLINRFLSLLAWCDDQFCTVQEGWSGTRYPVGATKRNLAFATAPYWPFDRKLSPSRDVRIALALYREGRNAEDNYLVAYAVLSYYKIIEVKHNGKAASKKWLKDNYGNFRETPNLVAGIKHFENACGSIEPHQYIYQACRVAVAHVNEKHLSDPDDYDELRRLHVVADVMRGLARYFIQNELGVSTHQYDGS